MSCVYATHVDRGGVGRLGLGTMCRNREVEFCCDPGFWDRRQMLGAGVDEGAGGARGEGGGERFAEVGAGSLLEPAGDEGVALGVDVGELELSGFRHSSILARC